MRVFIFDMGWQGGLVILANSPEDAFEKLPPEERVSDNGHPYTSEDFVELTEANSPYRLYGDQ